MYLTVSCWDLSLLHCVQSYRTVYNLTILCTILPYCVQSYHTVYNLTILCTAKFTEGYFLKNRGLSAVFHDLLFTKVFASYLKCVVNIICGRVWFDTDFAVWILTKAVDAVRKIHCWNSHMFFYVSSYLSE